MNEKIVIVGGNISAITCANRLRRLSEDLEITLIRKGKDAIYSKIGFPSFVSDIIRDKNDLVIESMQDLLEKYNIQVRAECEVISIQDQYKKVVVKDLLNNKEFEVNYDYLVLAMGSKVDVVRINIAKDSTVFKLESMEDALNLKQYIQTEAPKSCVIVGASHLGLELAETMSYYHIDTTIIEPEKQILADYDEDIAKIVLNHISSNGVKVILNNEIGEIQKERVLLKNGGEIYTDFVLFANGTKPNTAYLKNSKIRMDELSHIMTDKYLRTNIRDVYAIGNIVLPSTREENHMSTKHVNTSIVQARIAANNILNSIRDKELEEYDGSQNTSAVKIFDMTLGMTGYTHQYLKENKVKAKEVIVMAKNHPEYMGDARDMTLKLLFNEVGTILSAQAVGSVGVDKRIDILSTAIYFKSSVHDLYKLELCYAPFFNNLKDIVNLAGAVAANTIDYRLEVIRADQLLDKLDLGRKEISLIDVRSAESRTEGIIEGTIHIPLLEFRKQIGQLDKNYETIVYCTTGQDSYIAAQILKDNGFKNVKYLMGGYSMFKEYNKVVAFRAENVKNFV